MRAAGGPIGWDFQKTVGQRLDLFTQKFGSAVIKENKVCQLALSG
jgi:hypothetical protein